MCIRCAQCEQCAKWAQVCTRSARPCSLMECKIGALCCALEITIGGSTKRRSNCSLASPTSTSPFLLSSSSEGTLSSAQPPSHEKRPARAPARTPSPYRNYRKVRRRKRTRLETGKVADTGEILPRIGDFPRLAIMQARTVLETQEAAKWAVCLMQAKLQDVTNAANIKKWLQLNWDVELDRA